MIADDGQTISDARTELEVRDEGAVRTLTVNRADCRNALNVALIERMRQCIAAAISDPSVGALVFTGAPPAFCSGLDLNELQASWSAGDDRSPVAERFFELIESIRQCPKPTLAAVNGPAAAGGATLASVCDCVIAARSARIGYPGVRRGVTASIVVPLLLRQVGERRAKRLLLTGELVSAATAQEMGLVDEVVDDEQLSARAAEAAIDLLDPPQQAFAETKRFINEFLPGGAALFDSAKAQHSQVRFHARASRRD